MVNVAITIMACIYDNNDVFTGTSIIHKNNIFEQL